MNTVVHNGEILTGRTWRQGSSSFRTLPFHTAIPRKDELTPPIQMALSGELSGFQTLLLKFAQGLDDVHPFSDTASVDALIRDAENIVSADSTVGPKSAGRIWGFMSKFVMMDRFARSLGLAETYPGMSMPKKVTAMDTLGGAAKLLDDLNPPSKIIRKFLRTWVDREKSRAQYSSTAKLQACSERQEAAGIALTLSRRLIAAVKVRRIVSMEAGLEIMALAMTISSENSGVFPETGHELKNLLQRIWAKQSDEEQFEEILDEMQTLHKFMKNMMEFVFATSPLLALSPGGWLRSIHSTYLVRVFNALGNDRPEILIRMEDQVLQAIMGLCEGKSRPDVMDALYVQIEKLEKDLANDVAALEWFNLGPASSMSSPPAPSEMLLSSEIPVPAMPHILKDKFGLASPPESRNNSPQVPVAGSSSSSHLPFETLPPPYFPNPTDCHGSTDSYPPEVGLAKTPQVPEQQVLPVGNVLPHTNPRPRSRSSSLSALSDMDVDENPLPADRTAKSSSSQAESKVLPTIVVKPRKARFDPVDEDRGEPMVGVSTSQQSATSKSKGDEGEEHESEDEPSDSDYDEDRTNTKSGKTKKANESVDADLASQLASFDLRRSRRLQPNSAVAAPSSGSHKRKPSKGKQRALVKQDRIVVLGGSDDERPMLANIAPATYHPTLYANISGWGSTFNGGPRPYHHVPVQIIRPGNIASTADDTQTLRKVEALIQAQFKDGNPPHLRPDATRLSYLPGSDQSRIFVSSSAEFAGLQGGDIQNILRQRVILVHGLNFDYEYGWNLESFGRLFDVDKKISVLVSSLFHPHKPDLRHHQGTLRDFHRMTKSNQEFPPLNALSLPATHRNLYVPPQFGSYASHEVAQSRVPTDYEKEFEVPNLKSQLEWTIIGGQGAISPFHIDSDGLGTVVVVLEGTKYWVVATPVRGDGNIGTVDSLPGDWNPYHINDGDKIDGFRFEAVHLQKGDMLILPPGVLHWVLSTSNAICVGRHFYSSSTVRLSVVSIVRTFFLGGALTNEDHLQTRTLLYQLLVFWSMRIDQTDVDGAHIPSFSSEEEFFDIVYLGIFVILSPAFDPRFYFKRSANLVNEVTYAVQKFECLMHVFSLRFLTLVGGQAVAVSYIWHRMLAEFAAAAVVFGTSVGGPFGDGDHAGISMPRVLWTVEDILRDTCPDVLPFFSTRTKDGHKDFLWTGPQIQILARSSDMMSILGLTTKGELLDVPGCAIYRTALEDPPANPAPSAAKHGRSEEDDERASKRRKD